MSVVPWSARDVAMVARTMGFPEEALRLRDRTFRAVSKRHMLGDHYDYVESVLLRRGLIDWTEDWDCDDFTLLYVLESHIAHRRAQRSLGMIAESEMVFECWVASLNHAIACCFEQVPGERKLRCFFVEPQPRTRRRELQLTRGQIETCTLLK